MIILMQEQLRTRNELSPAHRQKDAIGARGRRYASMKLRVARAFDHDHTVHRLLEHPLECRGYCSRKHVAASDHSTLLPSMAAIAHTGNLMPSHLCRHLQIPAKRV